MSNPFDDDDLKEYANPFQDAAVTKALNETDGDEDFSSAYAASYTPYKSPPPAQDHSDKPWKQQQPQMSESEMLAIAKQKQELMLREEELERQRQQFVASVPQQDPPQYTASQQQQQGAVPFDATKPNWPVCYPFLVHSVKDEIPFELRKLGLAMYYSWYLNCICYIINLAACMAILISADLGKDFGYSIMYLVFNIPLSFFLWYRPAYFALKQDSSFYFHVFFFFGAWHIFWMLYIMIGIQDSGSAGFANTVLMFNKDLKGAGAVCLVALLFWLMNIGISVFLFIRLRQHFTSRGHTFNEARNQVLTNAAANPQVQQVAATAATSYIQQQMSNPYSRQVDEDV